MNINIKKLSIALLIFDLVFIAKSLPIHIITFTSAIVLLSFLVTHPFWRNTVKVVLLVMGLFLIKFVFKMFLMTEAGVSLVLILASLKLWELDSENDHFNMFLILALLESCLFLIEPSFWMFTLGFLKILFYFYFILKIRNYDLSLLSIKRLLILIIPSMVLSVLMFYTFPRFTQGFLNANNNQFLFSGSAQDINFTELGALNLSSSIAFRAWGIDTEKKALNSLYWRTNILWEYSQQTWKSGFMTLKGEQPLTKVPIEAYRIMLSSENNEFLPVLDGTTQMSRSSSEYHYYTEGSFRLTTPTRQKVDYDAQTSMAQNITMFTPLLERKGLKLNSPKKELIASKISPQYKELSDDEKIDKVIAYFKKRKYEYTLSPPQYQSLEDFILKGREGYCSHFAAALTYMARAVGLPARIVSGYQGGEFNPFDQSIIVRELDAHAWVEIYHRQKGWVRIDPTTFVAPGRIELGSKNFHDQLEPYINFYYFQFPKRFLDLSWISKLSLYFDSVNSNLSTRIFNFDQGEQNKILSQLYSKRISAGWFFVVALIAFLAIVPLLFFWASQKSLSPDEKRYRRFLQTMKKNGYIKAPGETTSAFCNRCQQSSPELFEYIKKERESYLRSFYQN